MCPNVLKHSVVETSRLHAFFSVGQNDTLSEKRFVSVYRSAPKDAMLDLFCAEARLPKKLFVAHVCEPLQFMQFPEVLLLKTQQVGKVEAQR